MSFGHEAERHRRELVAHCYRMLGSVDDAEDAVQETYLRAWRAIDDFEGRSSLRVWLYRIATNVCLTALSHHSRRVLPSGLTAPSDDPHRQTAFADPEVRWLQPLPDALVTSEDDDPAAITAMRDSIRLALIASLQHLPPRQRAVLVLRDVLAFTAPEVAEVLDMSVDAVKSALRRARVRLAEVSPATRPTPEPTDQRARELLRRYLDAFEQSDAAALEELLRADAALEMVPARTWFAGKTTCAPYLATHAMEEPGDWRMEPLRVNGRLGAVSYLRGRRFALVVLDLAEDGIARITLFGDPVLDTAVSRACAAAGARPRRTG
ncbi:RNA polymerase subunit sigma-70 [Saccharothrix variisporea]|uniref:RNA polymerase ECF family sigma subunit n=1 Tax=Saccharothrix variisporea TaxID=543527 RepID=A0A495X3X1_9PSEU|nr:RNA polymerase subunit sigma-70 [Saccharothrix variisporea]RKT68951.1 RNA polymerase ECF family sigma subunit [Saccharothrix variisporea]